ncbi:PPA1309 family protein [Arcanobacterium hippocoleae]
MTEQQSTGQEEQPHEITPKLQALKDAALEIEKYVAAGGWDGPIRVFALVNAKAALAAAPELQADLPADINSDILDSTANDYTLFSVEQENLPHANSLGELLGQIYWPDSVDGAAISVERVILPASAEIDLPKNESAALNALQSHPDRQDVRMVAAYMRSGETWGALRMRNHDKDSLVLSSETLLAELCSALAVTFTDLSAE